MTRVLLTGATGFVGAAILRRLLADGHEVAALHCRGRPALSAPGLDWHQADLLGSSAAELQALVNSADASHCVHAAWYTHHADYLVADVNRDWASASLRLAEAFYADGGVRFVGLGTCLEYDQKVGDGRFAETSPLRPETLYARCKAAVFEQLSQHDRIGSSFAWARVFFVYGPGDRANRLLPYILQNLANRHPVSARFGGLRRDYIHVDDLAGQIVRIALGNVAGPVNTGTGSAVGLAEIFRLAGDLAGRPDLVHTNTSLDPDQHERIEADMSRFEAVVGPPEARPIADGLAALIARQP